MFSSAGDLNFVSASDLGKQSCVRQQDGHDLNAIELSVKRTDFNLGVQSQQRHELPLRADARVSFSGLEGTLDPLDKKKRRDFASTSKRYLTQGGRSACSAASNGRGLL